MIGADQPTRVWQVVLRILALHRKLVPLLAPVYRNPDLSLSALTTGAACKTLVYGSCKGTTLTDLGER